MNMRIISHHRERSRVALSAGRVFAAALVSTGALLTPVTYTAGARGQQPAPSTAAADPEARMTARYEAGLEAAKKERWEDAYGAFLDAWRAREHPQIAANLGRAALKTGRPREAAERLTYFLREAKEISPEDRAQTERMLAEARTQVGTLMLRVNRVGVELALDGVVLGKAPIGGEVFVDPGQRMVEARAPGQAPARVEVEVRAGSTHHVGLWLPEAGGPEKGAAQPREAKEQGAAGIAALRGPILGAGIAATVVAAGLGTGLALGSLSKAAEREEVPYDTAPNQQSHDRLDGERRALANGAFWSFVVAGALGAGTLGFALLAPKAGDERAVRVEARATGLVVKGKW